MIDAVIQPGQVLLPTRPVPPTPASKYTCPLDEESAKDQARKIKALSDPTRLRIISLLSKHAGIIDVQEIVDCFTLEQPTISHHLRILRDSGFIDVHKRGLHAYYYVRQKSLDEVWQNIMALGLTKEVE